MIIVTGATGKLGRGVVERLLDRVAPEQVGVSVRDPDRARDLADRGVRVRRGDFAEPATLPAAFEGAEQVLIVSGPAEVDVHRTAIEAAVTAGATRVLYTSHAGANPESYFTPMHQHVATEHDLRACGAAWTSLRNGFYATNAVMLFGDAAQTGELALPEDGPVAWTAHADLAEAAALAMTGRTFDGPTPPLTAAEALDFTAIAAIASELTGRTINRRTVGDEEWVAAMVANGMPEANARMLLTVFVASRHGQFAEVDPAMGELLGRAPTPFRDVLAQSLTRAVRG